MSGERSLVVVGGGGGALGRAVVARLLSPDTDRVSGAAVPVYGRV